MKLTRNKHGGESITFESTGREVGANCHLIGINEKGATSGGYDSELFYWDDPPTPEERRELSLYMMVLWAKWGMEQ